MDLNNKEIFELDKDVIKIDVVDREDHLHELIAPTGIDLSVMELCKMNDLPIEGTCGGMALCASCHVYVLSKNELSNPSEAEEDMLDQAFFVEDNSRLCCQIKLDQNVNNLKIKLAPQAD